MVLKMKDTLNNDQFRDLTRSEAIKDYKHLRKVTARLKQTVDNTRQDALTRVSMKDYLRRETNRMTELVDKMLELKLEFNL